MIIAIDGPAGAGKSTVAQGGRARAGSRLPRHGRDVPRRDAAASWREAIDPANGEACGRLAGELDLTFDDAGSHPDRRGGGRARHPRSERDTPRCPRSSAHPRVRAAVVAAAAPAGRARRARRRGARHDDRRLPRRRPQVLSHRQRDRARAPQAPRELGREQALERVRTEIGQRDRLDSTREHSPLQRAPDAVLVETDGLDVARGRRAHPVGRARERPPVSGPAEPAERRGGARS